MIRACIAVVDASRARLFRFDHQQAPENSNSKTQSFEEISDLINPEGRMKTNEFMTDSQPASHNARNGVGRPYGVDDHRERHQAEMSRRFAASIVKEIQEVAEREGVSSIILCASPKMLGVLRTEGVANAVGDRSLTELDSDLTKLTPSQLQDHLAQQGLLPERQRLMMRPNAG